MRFREKVEVIMPLLRSHSREIFEGSSYAYVLQHYPSGHSFGAGLGEQIRVTSKLKRPVGSATGFESRIMYVKGHSC